MFGFDSEGQSTRVACLALLSPSILGSFGPSGLRSGFMTEVNLIELILTESWDGPRDRESIYIFYIFTFFAYLCWNGNVGADALGF